MRGEALTAMTMFARDLVATGRTRTDRSADELRDALWAYHSVELYDLLVGARAWSVPSYREFAAESMVLATAPR